MAQAGDQCFSYEAIQTMANNLLEQTKHRPIIGMVCGSGLGALVNSIKDADVFPYDKIPNFPVSTVHGHAGKLVFGTLNGKTVVCMQGRAHYYEGYSMNRVTLPIRVMHLLGVKMLIVTNAAGGVNPSFSVGDIMILKDHINFLSFAGQNPLRGPNEERFGPRFPPMNKAYTKELREVAKEAGKELGFSSFLREGVYACLGGPTYETIAEVKYLHTVGADAVGMSTAHEVIIAAHCGMKCLGISLITNVAVMSYDADINVSHEEVLEVGKKRSVDVVNLVKCIVKKIAGE